MQLAAEERPFEALILRAQELQDCVPLLFPLTNSVYLRRWEGWADLLCNVGFAEGTPAKPFVGWRRDAWAIDLPSFLRIAAARTAFEEGREDCSRRSGAASVQTSTSKICSTIWKTRAC